MVAHRLAERYRRAEVIVVIFKRHLDRFSDRLESGEVNDAVDGVARENFVELFSVAHVRLIEGDGPSGYLLQAISDLLAAVDEVINNDDLHAALKQLHAGMAAYKAHTASN